MAFKNKFIIEKIVKFSKMFAVIGENCGNNLKTRAKKLFPLPLAFMKRMLDSDCINGLQIHLFFPKGPLINLVLFHTIFLHVKQKLKNMVQQFDDVFWRRRFRWESYQSHVVPNSGSILNVFWDHFRSVIISVD